MKKNIISPFRGLRYNPKKINELAQVMAPPYDVIDEDYRKALYERHANNIVRLILTRDEEATEGKTKYDVAAQTLSDWRKNQDLVQEETPAIYVYHQTYTLEDGRQLTRRGFIARRLIESFENGKIRPHEYTFAGPKADRLHLIKATQANLSCIFGIYSDAGNRVEALLKEIPHQKPQIDIVTDDGNRHQVWVVSDPQIISSLNEMMQDRTVLIADGHHRYETALNYRNFCREQGVSGDDHEFVMMYLCAMEDPGLVILPTHRVVTIPVPAVGEGILRQLRENFDVMEYARADESQALEHLQGLSKDFYAFLAKFKEGPLLLFWTDEKRLQKIGVLANLAAPVRNLDVTILHHYLLPHVFQVDVGEEHDSVKIRYVKGTREALEMVGNQAEAAFLLNPTKISQVEAISDIGERMPHKSTFFYPKLLSGLVINPLEKDAR